MRYAFGDCELDLDRIVLSRDGVVQPVEPQVFEVLSLLISERDRVVSKEELLDTVWGSRFVSESALTSRIKTARQAIGDSGRHRRLIRTVHGRGYQFIGDVVELNSDADVSGAGPLPWTAVAGDNPVELVEREAELAELRELWAHAEAGRGSIVLVAGESGAGKTALARATAAAAAGESARVLWGMCTPLATPAPFEPLREAAAQLSGPLASRVHDDVPAHQILPSLLVELTRVPTVLVVDDLQWADQATIDLLRLLARRVQRTRTLVIGTHREEKVGIHHPLRGLIGDVARANRGRQLSVGPLSRDAVARLVAGTGRDPDDVLRLTGGNAFFVQEVATATGDLLPATVREAVLARTADLPSAAHDVLALLACAPEAVPDVALPALQVDLPTLRSLDQTGLLERGPRGLRFRHELCRLAVAEGIPPGGEIALHARVLAALERDGHGDPSVLTHHALGAKDAKRVVRYAPLAGRRAAATGAHVQAISFYEAALAQPVEIPDAVRAELLEALANELYLLDRVPEAIAAAERARSIRITLGDMAGVGSIHETLSHYEYYNANRDRAERHAARAIKLLEPSDRMHALGHAYATEAYLAIQRCDVERAVGLLDRVSEIAGRQADPALQTRLDVMRTAVGVLVGQSASRDELLEVAAAGFQAELHEQASTGYSLLAYFDVEKRRLDDARELLGLCLPLAADRDIRICHMWQKAARGRLSMLRGDWDEALRDADDILGSSGVLLGRPWAELVRGLVLLRRGDAGAAEHLDVAWDLANRLDEPLRTLPATAALVEQAWLTGQADERIEAAPELLEAYATAPALEWSAGDLAVWLRRLGRPVPAGLRMAEPYRLTLTGDAAGAARSWAKIGEPYEEAMALLDTGSDKAAFRALELLDTLGAAAVAAKVRQQLRDRGVTNVPAGPRATTRGNPAGLTERQVEVLGMLAEGLSNAQLASRLFISPKTVDHHVSAILGKLQASSRTEAVHIARERGIIA